MKQQNIFQTLVIAIKKGLLTPTVPNKIIILQNNIYIKLLKLICSLFTILMATHNLNILGSGLLLKIILCLIVFLNIILIIYLTHENYYRIKYMFKILKNDK